MMPLQKLAAILDRIRRGREYEGKPPIFFVLATMIAAPALAGEGASPATGAIDAPSLCIVGRASDRARPLQPKPRSEAEEKRELDAVADALLRCPTVDEKVQTEVPVRPALPAQTAWRSHDISIPAGNG